MRRGVAYELIRLALPRGLRDRLRGGDSTGALARLLGDDAVEDPVVCICNTYRYYEGHMESCPMYGLPASVVVLDRADPRRFG